VLRSRQTQTEKILLELGLVNKLFSPNKLLLQELKDIANATPRPLRWAMVWFLLWLEPQYVEYKAKKAVDDAVKEYKKICDWCEDYRTDYGVTITQSDVENLQNMSINYDGDTDKETPCDI